MDSAVYIAQRAVLHRIMFLTVLYATHGSAEDETRKSSETGRDTLPAAALPPSARPPAA